MRNGRVLALVVLAVTALVGTAMAQGRGGWWNRMVPSTPEQKAYVDEAARLQAKIRLVRQELWGLQAQEKPAPAALRAKQAELDGLRTQLQALNTKNRVLIQQMASENPCPYGNTPGSCGMGPCGGVPGSACPYGGPGNGNGWRRGGGRGACRR